MEDLINALIEHIAKWRSHQITDYWVHVGYMGNDLHRFGDHTLTFVDGKLWRRWENGWREVENGRDFWLFSVPGSFAWARDMIAKVLPQDEEITPETFKITYDDEYGYVRELNVSVGHRDSANFTYEVKRFGVGPHPDFA
jgi:hypothetical protein